MKDNRDVLLASDATMVQGLIVEGGNNDEEVPPNSTTGVDYNEGEFVGLPSVGPRRAVRELEEDDFESEIKVDDNIIFDESDQVYGEILDAYNVNYIAKTFGLEMKFYFLILEVKRCNVGACN